MSNSLWPHGLQPTRLLCLWDYPGKNSGMGCHSLPQGIFPTERSSLGLLNCRQIFCYMSHQGSHILPNPSKMSLLLLNTKGTFWPTQPTLNMQQLSRRYDFWLYPLPFLQLCSVYFVNIPFWYLHILDAVRSLHVNLSWLWMLSLNLLLLLSCLT